MTAEPATPGHAGREGRARLDRERILDAAEAIAQREGVGKLTIRRIGAELNADPTAIYRHFRDKQELLSELADRFLARCPSTTPHARGASNCVSLCTTP
jgi:AcrR family transcriptional regulator